MKICKTKKIKIMLNLKEFIEKNDIDLSGTDSELNSNCTIVIGYALYIGFDNILKIFEELESLKLFTEVEEELERVFNYAYKNSYENWWKNEKNRKQYITE